MNTYIVSYFYGFVFWGVNILTWRDVFRGKLRRPTYVTCLCACVCLVRSINMKCCAWLGSSIYYRLMRKFDKKQLNLQPLGNHLFKTNEENLLEKGKETGLIIKRESMHKHNIFKTYRNNIVFMMGYLVFHTYTAFTWKAVTIAKNNVLHNESRLNIRLVFVYFSRLTHIASAVSFKLFLDRFIVMRIV